MNDPLSPLPARSGAFCAVHPERRALTLCHRCGSYACDACAQVGPDGRDYCAACLPRLQPVLATRGNRFVATLVDKASVYLPYLLLARLGDHMHAHATGLLMTGLGLMASLGVIGYQLYLFQSSGQTLGKRLVDIKVVRTDGSRVDLGQLIFLRHLVPATATVMTCGLFGLIDALFIFSGPRRCLHDHIADTRVLAVKPAER